MNLKDLRQKYSIRIGNSRVLYSNEDKVLMIYVVKEMSVGKKRSVAQ